MDSSAKRKTAPLPEFSGEVAGSKARKPSPAQIGIPGIPPRKSNKINYDVLNALNFEAEDPG